MKIKTKIQIILAGVFVLSMIPLYFYIFHSFASVLEVSITRSLELTNNVILQNLQIHMSTGDQAKLNAAKEVANSAISISRRSSELLDISKDFTKLVGQTTFDPNARKRICKPELIFELSQRKIEHILFKETNYAKLLESDAAWRVTDANSCNLGKWIGAHEHSELSKVDNWSEMKNIHSHVHDSVQELIDEAKKGASSKKLMDIAAKVERDTLEIFENLDKTKEKICEQNQFKGVKRG